MQKSTQIRRAFALVEMVVVLAITGIALSLVGPSLLLAPRTDALPALVADARRSALVRAETVTLSVAMTGEWQLIAERTGTRIRKGKISSESPDALSGDCLSAWPVHDQSESSGKSVQSIDPFACGVTEAGEGSR